MSVRLIIQPEAEADLGDAYRWYEAQREGLGEEFLLSVDAVLESIQRNSRLYAIVYKQLRRALTRRFPYGVFYQAERDAVLVFAVFHASRDPKSWQERV